MPVQAPASAALPTPQAFPARAPTASSTDSKISPLCIALIAALIVGLGASLSLGLLCHNPLLGTLVGISTAAFFSLSSCGMHYYCLDRLTQAIGDRFFDSFTPDEAYRNIPSGKEKIQADLQKKHPAYLVKRMDKKIEELARTAQRRQLEVDIQPAMDYLVERGLIFEQTTRMPRENLVSDTSTMTANLILHLKQTYHYPQDFLEALAANDDVAPNPRKLSSTLLESKPGYFAIHIREYVLKRRKREYALNQEQNSQLKTLLYDEGWKRYGLDERIIILRSLYD